MSAHARTTKSGQRPFFNRTHRSAAKLAGRRRARPSRGQGRRTWLQKWPRGSNQPNTGNSGRPPAYSDRPYDGTSWRRGKS